MADFSAKDVKELRERSGAGMMDAKKALVENDGNMEAAIDWLRTKGLAAAAKKAGRTAAEGLIGVAVKGTTGAAVEVNSETDFVAKNDKFQDFVGKVTQIALDIDGDVEALKAAEYPGGGDVETKLTENISTIGENQSLRRVGKISVEKGAIVPYVHNAVTGGMGKIGVLVALESDAGSDVLEPLGKQLAMHIAAAAPLALTGDDLDPDTVERERAIAAEKAAESGKPDNIVEKMVEGAIAKYRKENALMSQVFVIDNKTKIEDVVAGAAKDAGSEISLKGYIRFQLGEGIEKKEENFAEEVAAAVGA